jgi:hypothetical protein
MFFSPEVRGEVKAGFTVKRRRLTRIALLTVAAVNKQNRVV